MNYSDDFIQFVDKCFELKQFVGFGDPSSSVLIIGKETSTDAESNSSLDIQNAECIKNNASDWKKNISNKISGKELKDWEFIENLPLDKIQNNPIFPWKGTIKRDTSDTWKKYQKLHDVICFGKIDRDNSKKISFLNDFFITEMNQTPSKKTKNAKMNPNFRKELEFRKKEIINSNFIKHFPVIVLACSDYIWNTKSDMQISNIFNNVTFDKEYFFSEQNKFWTHYDNNYERLVIHTRQLSMAVMDEMIIEIGQLINQHLKKQKLWKKRI